MNITILIVSDICLYRAGLERALYEDKRLTVVGTAASSDEVISKVTALKPDIVLLDITMKDHCAIIRQLIAMAPDTRIVALTVPEDPTEMLACAEAGIAGYLTRGGSLEELVQSVAAAAAGELQCSPSVAGRLLQRLRALAAEHSETVPPPIIFTTRELRILELIEKGLPNKEIAQALNIEVGTVKNHVHHILQKLHVH
ncbi:MAG TPA: response regulator transcription factor, partial [Candidatus Competibacteraceae bacterium]|nr:response regulator transcription factor [Candidatus Competibacteraceae bacterium]